MHRLTDVVGSVVGTVRRLARLDATPDTRRQVFREEFGQNPPQYEASASAREQFAREVVRPVLDQRAHAVQDGAAGAGEAFTRAYRVAVDMGLVEKGQTHRDYLDPNE